VLRIFSGKFIPKAVSSDTENYLICPIFNRRKLCADIGDLLLFEKPFHSWPSRLSFYSRFLAVQNPTMGLTS